MLEGKITRFEAARQVHDALLNIRKEPDEEKWQCALDLKDIYDCNKCVANVAQSYVKGIITPGAEDEFRGTDIISEKEKKEILERLFDESKRQRPCSPAEVITYKYISYEEALMLKEKGARFIDVRTPDLYEEKYNELNFVNIPYSAIYLNPYSVAESTDKDVVLRCNKGYLSTVTAKLLIEHGYKKVYVFVAQ